MVESQYVQSEKGASVVESTERVDVVRRPGTFPQGGTRNLTRVRFILFTP